MKAHGSTSLGVGFTGHRKISDPAMIAEAIARELAWLRDEAPSPLAAISSVASGADTLFAEEVLKLGIPWTALLPFPGEEFAEDFGPAEWARAEECLARATAVEVCSSSANRPQGYYDVGVKMAAACDVLFAVWNGGPSGGIGGTAEIVGYARRMDKPVVWIQLETGVVIRERFADSASGPHMGFD